MKQMSCKWFLLVVAIVCLAQCNDNEPFAPDEPDTAPNAVSNLVILGEVDTMTTLAWSAPSDPQSGKVDGYDIRFATDSTVLQNWQEATPIDADIIPGMPGSAQRASVYDLKLSNDYWFALKSYDSAGNLSELSNMATKQYGSSPRVLVTSPENGSSVADLVRLRATAGDDKGVVSVEFYVDDEYVGQSLAPPYEVDWDAHSASDGSDHVIYAIARDTDQNVNGSTTITVTIDTILGIPAAPEIVEEIGSDSGLSITWRACPDNDFDHYEVRWDTDSSFSNPRRLQLYNQADTVRFLTMPWNEVVYYVEVITFDQFARRSSTATSHYTADVDPPPVTGVEVVRSSLTTVRVSWQRVDINDFLSYNIRRSADSVPSLTDQLVGTILDIDSTVLHDLIVPTEVSYYYVEAYDQSSHKSISASYKFDYLALDTVNWALRFDGYNDYLRIPYTLATLGSASLTIEMWIHPFEQTDHNIVFGQALHVFELDIAPGDGVWLIHQNGSISINESAFPVNSWTHFAAVYDATNTTLIAYVNGVEHGRVYCLRGSNEGDLIVGFRALVSAYPFKGMIDEIRIWDYPVSGAEIGERMNVEFFEPPSGLVGYYPFKEGIGGVTGTGIGPEATLGGSLEGDSNEPTWVMVTR